MQKNPQPLHPRRPPAHLSVCLRHESPSISSNRTDADKLSGRNPAARVDISSSFVSPIRKRSDESNNSGDSSGGGTWFDRSNKHPAVNLNEQYLDSEPPYFLPRNNSSDASKVLSDSSPHLDPNRGRYGMPMAGVSHSATKGSSADDFRSVIDDLTIENRKLKERLRKYEGLYSAHLEKDKLFEVKVHGLPAKKKRELEETLRSFAASIDGSSDSGAKLSPRGIRQHNAVPASKNTSLSSSMSRPTDSAYASMSISGPTSTSTSKHIGEDRAVHNQNSKDQSVQSFLHNIPEGLLPKHSSVMTERQKQKMVVRRLEQLFTGKKGSAFGEHSQPLQQQEVSESAALADRVTNTGQTPAEGIREAHILPFEMEVDSMKLSKQADTSSHEEDNSRGPSDDTTDSSPDASSLEQRPTRPLDLDPDRAQIPSDNVEYIRHLGLSTPNFRSWSSGDVEPDADGWIYLNLLISMAQLHIINVTPDFVRCAVADVSDKFQLSRDGKKIRWRGGTEGTRMSSDSGTGSSHNRSPTDSDYQEEESRRKRRKTECGKFASVPIENAYKNASKANTPPDPLFYKPLFHHRGSSSEETPSSGESEPPFGYGYGYGHGDGRSGTGRNSRTPRLRSRGSHSMSGRSTRRHDNGPIVFYSGAQFCIDLSGDRRSISTPLHETAVGKDGYSNHSKHVVGSAPRKSGPPMSRTPSGSLMQFRPFKDYSKGPDLFQTSESRAKTPDMIIESSNDLDFSLEWSRRSAPAKPLIDFSASGLGGTQPADHFAVQVETRRTIHYDHKQPKLSKFSAPRPSSKKFVHRIPRSALKSFQESERASSDDLSAALASLNARTPSPQAEATSHFPVKTDIVSVRFARLQPSTLPAPLGYYTMLSSEESGSDFSGSSSYSGISHLRRASRSHGAASVHVSTLVPQDLMEREQDSGEMQDEEEDDESGDSDESIDMLAAARQADPETIAKREAEFELQASRKMIEELPIESSAASVDGESRAPSAGSESSEYVELD